MGHSTSPQLTALWKLVKSVPRGRVVSYGAIGRALPNPCSGFLVGRWMASAPDGVPWWRVVNAKGSLPIGKRDPRLEFDQRAKLEYEGVVFSGDSVAAECFWEPD